LLIDWQANIFDNNLVAIIPFLDKFLDYLIKILKNP